MNNEANIQCRYASGDIEETIECMRGDLSFSVERTSANVRWIAPVSPVWMERGRGRFKIFESAMKAAAGVGRLRSSNAAIVYSCVSSSSSFG